MKVHPSIQALIEEAESAPNPALWETIARQLMASGAAGKPATRKPKPVVSELLTREEKLALGLAYKPDRLEKNGAYQWALATFEGGYRQIVGYYPRKGEEGELTAKKSAYARYLLAISGRYINPDLGERIPPIASVDIGIDSIERAMVTRRLQAMRSALETFGGIQ